MRGRPTIRDANGTEISETAVGNPYLFTGRRYDAETALYYYRARYYDYYAGRFLQPDPMGYVDGLNLYAYVVNNSVNRVDPSGLKYPIVTGPYGKEVVDQAFAYISQDPRGEALIKRIIESPLEFNIKTNTIFHPQATRFHGERDIMLQPVAHWIDWNPDMAVSSLDRTESRSPAMALMHEFVHYLEYYDAVADMRAERPKEVMEPLIISHLNPLAKSLGETHRTSHEGFVYWAESVTSTAYFPWWDSIPWRSILDLLNSLGSHEQQVCEK